jgi:thiamine-phosphate pyrophosphorylase
LGRPVLPPLYPIVDAGLLQARGIGVAEFARVLLDAGVTLLQYRDKASDPQGVLRGAASIRELVEEGQCRLILNDRADLAVLAGWGGVHVGQEDMSPEDARQVVGAGRWIGVSTHTEEQVRDADSSCADYVAVGPVFATGTKLDAAPVIGLEGVRRARKLTDKPIVAIGGIGRANARSVIDAGADSVAVISDLLAKDEKPEWIVRELMRVLK